MCYSVVIRDVLHLSFLCVFAVFSQKYYANSSPIVLTYCKLNLESDAEFKNAK